MEEEGNGKITIAILGYRMNVVDKKLDGIEEKLDRFLKAQNEQENKLTAHEKQIGTNCDEIKTLRSSSRNWDIVTVITAVIGAITGIFGINK